MIVVRPYQKTWPIFWGVEHHAVGPVFDKTWMAETLPPWRRATHAVRIRVGSKALHVGTCKVMNEDDPLRGREDIEVDPEIIGEEFRRFDHVEHEDEVDATSRVEVEDDTTQEEREDSRADAST